MRYCGKILALLLVTVSLAAAFDDGSFTITVVKDKVLLFHNNAVFPSKVSIFNLAGQLVYSKIYSRKSAAIPAEYDIWDLTGITGQKVTDGTYIAVFASGTTTVTKVFTILREQ